MQFAADIDASHVTAFCREVVANSTPISLMCDMDRRAKKLDCFATVAQRVEAKGGESVYGWAIWELPGKLIEAEFHAVWRRPTDGSLIDISLHQAPFEHITFIPDPQRQYEDRQVNNIRKSLTDDPQIQQLIDMQDRIFEMLNSGSRSEQHSIELTPNEEAEYYKLMSQIESIARRVVPRF